MEEEDEIVPHPDIRGLLDLTNRAWVHLDPVIWTMSKNIIVLDLSYNRLTYIPSEIGELQLLRELRAAFNIISTLPPELGKLKRLRKLILNGNRIKSLPPEVGRLEMLEELILSENSLEEIPNTIATMAMLRVLKIQNNDLKTIPNELVDVVTLEELDFSGNINLKMVPKLWQGDTDSVLFVCKIHRDYQWQMSEMNVANTDLSKHSQFLEQEQLLMKEQVGRLKNEIDLLKRSMPKSALKKYERHAKVAAEIGEEAEEPKSKCVIM